MTRKITYCCLLILLLSLSKLSFALPSQIEAPGERIVLVDPHNHAWGAYTSDGYLARSGLASAGANYCNDIKSPCRTRLGEYRVYAMGGADCYSTRFPLPNGGAPMPYCMYFNENQALHGSSNVVYGNISHGCVRMRVGDAKWLYENFVTVGTKVIILPY